MGFVSIISLAVGLSMDAFAVAVCKGLAMKQVTIRKQVIVGLWFGSFQVLMPVIGYFLGIQFKDKIVAIDHWIAFILLGLIGVNMIREAVSPDVDAECQNDEQLAVKEMFVLAVATSIDALAVGITLAFLEVNIWTSVCLIGITTFILSAAGVKIGNVFGLKYKTYAEIVGGVVLILLGSKILMEHIGIL